MVKKLLLSYKPLLIIGLLGLNGCSYFEPKVRIVKSTCPEIVIPSYDTDKTLQIKAKSKDGKIILDKETFSKMTSVMVKMKSHISTVNEIVTLHNRNTKTEKDSNDNSK